MEMETSDRTFLSENLGVNYVQLMPVYDYGSVDEAGRADGFNWDMIH